MEKETKVKDTESQCAIQNVVRSCHNCANMMSMQQDVVCHMWCDEGDRDFTFGGVSYEACDKWEED